jgi:RNA polymerase sigma factor (sigma-70 family)
MSPILSLRPLQTQSDAKLVAMARGGHERAFEALVRRYRRQLLAYASRLAGADGRGEDALQHALLQAWIALRADAEVKDARAWLYRIVHNSAVTTLRRPRHETVELNEALDAPASDGEPDSRIAVGEVLKSLASLPDLQRQAMVLTAVRGDSHGEAAATLGLSDGAVRGLIYRARTTMRDAAAAVMPLGLFNWAASHGARRTPGGSNAADVLGTAGGAGSAGLAAAVLKGGAVVATAGALATAGQIAIPKVFGHSQPARSAAPAGHHAARQPGGSPGSGTEVSARSLHTSLTSSATVLHRGTVGNHERGRSGTSGGHSSSGSGEHSGDGAGHGGSRSPGLTNSGPGGSSGSGRGSGGQGGASSGGGEGGGSTHGGGDAAGAGGNPPSSGHDGSNGGDTSVSGSSGGDSSSGGSGSGGSSQDGGSADASSADTSHGGATPPLASTSTVAAPEDLSGKDSGTGSGDDASTGSGSTTISAGDSHGA